MTVSLRLLAVVSAATSVLFLEPALAQQSRHLYLYNECYTPVTVTAECGESANVKAVVESVPPGTQRLLCTSEGSNFIPTSKAATTDGKLKWSSLQVPVSANEYTHVITCTCKDGDANCKLPDRWPAATTRQSAEGQ